MFELADGNLPVAPVMSTLRRAAGDLISIDSDQLLQARFATEFFRMLRTAMHRAPAQREPVTGARRTGDDTV